MREIYHHSLQRIERIESEFELATDFYGDRGRFLSSRIPLFLGEIAH